MSPSLAYGLDNNPEDPFNPHPQTGTCNSCDEGYLSRNFLSSPHPFLSDTVNEDWSMALRDSEDLEHAAIGQRPSQDNFDMSAASKPQPSPLL